MKTKRKTLSVEFKASPVFYPPIKTQAERRREQRWHRDKARRWQSVASVFMFHLAIAEALA
jgi:hypothetical protein